MSDQNLGVGGSYVIDESGERRLVQRTDAGIETEAPAPSPAPPGDQQESHAQAETPVISVAPDDTTSKPE